MAKRPQDNYDQLPEPKRRRLPRSQHSMDIVPRFSGCMGLDQPQSSGCSPHRLGSPEYDAHNSEQVSRQQQLSNNQRPPLGKHKQSAQGRASMPQAKKMTQGLVMSRSREHKSLHHGRDRGKSQRGSSIMHPRDMPFLDSMHLHYLAEEPLLTIIDTLEQHQPDFNELLGSILGAKYSDCLEKTMLTIKVLARLLDSEAIAHNKRIDEVVLEELKSSSGRAFLHTLSDIFCETPIQSSPAERDNLLWFLGQVHLFFKSFLKRWESLGHLLPIDALHGCSRQLATQDVQYKEIHQRIQRLVEQRDSIRSMAYGAHVASLPHNEEENLALPTAKELRQTTLLHLQPNITKGPYTSTEEYLTIHYHLLREDFIHPLRCTLNKLQAEGEETPDTHEVRLYESVRFNEGTVSIPGEGMAFRVGFKLPGKCSNVAWDRTKCLAYGSLLCLSPDKFHTVYFASVAERKTEDLCKGIVTIKLETNLDGSCFPPDQVFQMADSPGYYAAYAPVIHRLAKLRNNPAMLPFPQYIVKCHCDSKIEPPKYFREGKAHILNLAEIVCDCPKDVCTHQRVDILDAEVWSKLETTCLDSSQKVAIQAALCRELAIIQGPPGTGKTFIGLKIVEALLQNSHREKENGPIIVVCYTNHALDQFLEGVLDIKAKQRFSSVKVRRIGGRCKSDKVEQYNIRTYVSKACHQVGVYNCSPHIIRKLMRKIEAITQLLDGDYVSQNFNIYCSLLEQQVISDFDILLGFQYLNDLSSQCEAGRLAGWLSYDFQTQVDQWFKDNYEHSSRYVYVPHTAIEDERRITTTDQEEESDTFLQKHLEGDLTVLRNS